jgi:hypothetical protein
MISKSNNELLKINYTETKQKNITKYLTIVKESETYVECIMNWKIDPNKLSASDKVKNFLFSRWFVFIVIIPIIIHRSFIIVKTMKTYENYGYLTFVIEIVFFCFYALIIIYLSKEHFTKYHQPMRFIFDAENYVVLFTDYKDHRQLLGIPMQEILFLYFDSWVDKQGGKRKIPEREKWINTPKRQQKRKVSLIIAHHHQKLSVFPVAEIMREWQYEITLPQDLMNVIVKKVKMQIPELLPEQQLSEFIKEQYNEIKRTRTLRTRTHNLIRKAWISPHDWEEIENKLAKLLCSMYQVPYQPFLLGFTFQMSLPLPMPPFRLVSSKKV